MKRICQKFINEIITNKCTGRTNEIRIRTITTCNRTQKNHNQNLVSSINQKQASFSTFNSLWNKYSSEERKDYGMYSTVHPGKVTLVLSVPNNIKCPSYSKSMKPSTPPSNPEIHNEEYIENMRKSCQLARYVLDTISKSLKVGITTDEIDKLAHKLIIENGAYPSPLNYMGYPKSICTSINNVACHGIPDDRILQDGDIINLDITVYLNGYHGDCSCTYLIGNVDDKGKQLVDTTKKCLNEAISICTDGEYFCNIGHVIETVSRREGFNVIPAFIGHGIGTYFHGPPDIYHCHNNYPGKMRAGMIFTIEPVISQGNREIVILEDGWTAVTLDNARTAQFEHTILVTKDKPEILTGPAW